MPCETDELHDREERFLAPCAQRSRESRGRAVPEPPPRWRTDYQRDRDRVIHSRAFRRLEYKTQVFLNGTGDHLRTRLTHTMEVAAISRNIAVALRLNEDLAEAIALAHDLGHAPFGHTGESVLNNLMKGHGGFEHNRQSLRVVTLLEQKYPEFDGLNLSHEVLEGLRKHQPPSPDPAGGFQSPSLEAQVANLADEIAYYSHDLDDGLDAGLLLEERLAEDIPQWAEASRQVRSRHPHLDPDRRRAYIIRCLIDDQVADVVQTTEARIADAQPRSADDVRRLPPLVGYSPTRREQNLLLRRYLYSNLYYNEKVQGPNLRSARMLERLFEHYLRHFGTEPALPHPAPDAPRERIVCDYLAGMTDRYALREYQRLVTPGS